MGFLKTNTLEEVKNILEDGFEDLKLSFELVDFQDALGRIAFEDIISMENIPQEKRSTVDGYGVRYRDTSGASESIPSIHNVIGKVEMGKLLDIEIGYGEGVYIPTGGFLPKGCDAVGMVEDIEGIDETTIALGKALSYRENILDVGEDIEIGQLIISRGEKINPWQIGALAALGITKVKVFAPVKFSIISTGDEVVSPYQPKEAGNIRDINTYALSSLIIGQGDEIVSKSLIKDERKLLEKELEAKAKECDILIVSGGSSKGERDYTAELIGELGELFVHGISIKPGKPSIIGRIGKCCVFGLPGNPLASALVYQEVVKTFVDCLKGTSEESYRVSGILEANIHSAPGRETLVPVYYKEGRVKPILTKSSNISALTHAKGILRVPLESEGIKAGTLVDIKLLR